MADKGKIFRQLHQKGDPFTLMNAWDIGSAKVFQSLGAKAIGTTSSGHAFTLGRPDMGNVTRDESLSHAQDLVSAVDIPVSGDFENGYGDDPDTVAETIKLAAEIGLAGCSIEDTNMSDPISYYDFDLAVERVKAAASAARALPHDFVFVARADGIMNGLYDIDEAIKRLQAFDKAGADCLYAPLPKTIDDLIRVINCTDKPVNVLAVGSYAKMNKQDFADLGVARISLGSGAARVIHKAIISTATNMIQKGDFSDILNGAPSTTVDVLLEGKA